MKIETAAPVPGPTKLLAYVRANFNSIPEFCESAGLDRLKTQRAITGDYTRMDVPFALTLERVTNGEITVEDWAFAPPPKAKPKKKAAPKRSASKKRARLA